MLISKDLQIFIKLYALVLELSQVVCGLDEAKSEYGYNQDRIWGNNYL